MNYYRLFPRIYCMDDLFSSSVGTFNFAEIDRARKRNRRAKAIKRSR